MNTQADIQHKFLTDPWWSTGVELPDHCGLCINETATRARAGLLNLLSGTTLFLLLAVPEIDPVRYVAPLVIFDMLTAATFGLTPISPAGILGTILTIKIRPVWKPVKPKRFAWTLGATLGACCFTFWLMGMTEWIIAVLGICFVLTWLEAVMGFCVGCWMYSHLFRCEACQMH
jgi:hypothetical protein